MKREIAGGLVLKDVFRAWCGDEEGAALADALSRVSGEMQILLVERLLDVYCGKHDDENALLMLEALARVTTADGNESLNFRIEPLFWRLDEKLTRSRLWICRRLMRQWTCDITDPRSLHAFRRLIAQMWPEPRRQQQRAGESDLEMSARGRDVSRSEQKGALALVADHLDSAFLLTTDQMTGNADALYSPWLAQPWVPSDLRSLLIVARAKHGDAKLVERDMRNGRILDGLPDSALGVIAGFTDVMRRTAGEAEEVLADIVRRTQERHTKFDAKANLQRVYEFTGTHDIKFDLRAEGEHDLSELHADAVLAINEARQEGKLRSCVTTLLVYTEQCEDKPGTELGNRWLKDQ